MLDREKLDEVCEWGIIGVILALVIYAALALGAARNSEFAIVCGLTLVVAGLWALRFWLNDSHRFLLHPVIWALFAFLAYAIWRSTEAPVRYFAGLELMRLLVYGVLFLVVMHNLHRQETTQLVVTALVILGLCLSFYALVQLATGSDKVLWFVKPANYVRRGGGTFINPNHLAGLLVMILPLAVAQVFVGRSTGLVKVLYGYAALVIAAGIGVTMSRGGWLATGVSMALMFGWLLRRRQHRIPALVAIGLLALGAFIYFKSVDAAKRRLQGVAREGTVDSGHSRKYLIEPAVKMWQDHVWLGAGPAQFDSLFPKYRPPSIQVAPGFVHNEYLQVLAEYGVAGSVLVLAFLGVYGWGAWKTSKYVERGSGDLGLKPSNRSAFFLGAGIGLTGFLVHCAVEFDLHIPGVALTAVLVAGLLASNIRFATDNFWRTPSLWSRALVTGMLIAFVAWLAPRSWRAYREGRLLNAAARATATDQSLLATLKAAAQIEPANPRTPYEIGENLRRLSWEGAPGYEQQARDAIEWLERAARLNPADPYPHLRIAMCRHWLGEKELAAEGFERALRMGPNDVTIANLAAWNLMLRGHLMPAKSLLLDSLRWNDWANPLARKYLELVDETLKRKQERP